MNKYIGYGRLTGDPEAKSASGNSFTTFSIAVNERQGQQDVATFVRCVAFGKVADIVIKYCKKGMPLIVEGKLRCRKDNQGVERWGIVVDTVTFAGTKSGGETRQKPASDNGGNQPKPDDGGGNNYPNDDIPF